MELVNVEAIKILIVECWGKLLLLCLEIIFFVYFCYTMIYYQSNILTKILVNFVFGGIFCYGVLFNVRTLVKIRRFVYKRERRRHSNCLHGVGCTACGNKDCINESDALQDPWSNLLIDYRLDLVIQEFYETILNNFVMAWYSLHSDTSQLTDDLRLILKYSSSILYRRVKKVNFAQLITHKLIPCGLNHFETFNHLKQNLKSDETLEKVVLTSDYQSNLHPAVSNRETELSYLRNATVKIMPIMLKLNDHQSKLFSTLIREIFCGWVLLPLVDLLADPYIINSLLMLLTDGEKMADIEIEPCLKVEFLHNFINDEGKDYNRRKLLQLNVQEIMQEPKYLYVFMQFLKNNNKVHILQFCLDVDDFNLKMLRPDLSRDEQSNLFTKAEEIYDIYFNVDSASALNFKDTIMMEMQNILRGGSSNITQLQTSEALFEAYEQAYNLLEDVWAPKFYHSEEFYGLIFGPRTAPRHNAQSSSKNKSGDLVSKLGNKLKGAIKGQTVDGHVLSLSDELGICLDTNSEEFATSDDNIDILKYLEMLSDPSKMTDKELNQWNVSIQEVYERQIESKSDYIFVINVQSGVEDDACGWIVERNENDFYLLKAKLVEIHKDQQLEDVNLPSRRANIPVDIIKIKYEDFIQKLLLKPFLWTSELLFVFLTSAEDFTEVAQQDYFLSTGMADINNVYQSVSDKLRKQKGQYLTTFLSNFLASTIVASVENENIVDEGLEAEYMEADLSESNLFCQPREIIGGVFGNNFDVELPQYNNEINVKVQTQVVGFCDCITYMASRIFQIPTYFYKIVFSIFRGLKHFIDPVFENSLNRFLSNILCQPRLAYLIKLAHELIFDPNDSPREMSISEQKLKVRMQLRQYIPKLLAAAMGPRLWPTLDSALDILQSPQLNKQLVMSLFDIVLVELFPEVTETSQEDDPS